MFWDGTRWVDERPTPTPAVFSGPRRLRDWIATVPILLLAPALLFPFLPAMATTVGPSLTVSGPATPGATLPVKASGFSSGTMFQLQWDGSSTGMPTMRSPVVPRCVLSVHVPSKTKLGTHVLTAVLPAWTQYAVRFGSAPATPNRGRTILASTNVIVVAKLSGAVATPPPSPAPPAGAAEPTPVPTAAPTARPTAAPTAAPTAHPTAAPTAAPTGGAPIGNLQAALNATPAGGTLDAGGQAFSLSHLTIPAGVTLADARITYTGGPGAVQTGMIDLSAGSTLRAVTASGGPYAVVRAWVGATNAAVVGSDISGGPALGIIGYSCDGFRLTGSRLHDNDTGVGNPGNEAGGIKLGLCRGVTISGNEVDHNVGPGIWADVSCANWTISANRVHDNTYAGLMIEISQGATISGNAVWENGWGDGRGWGWAADILISSSGGVTVTGNTVAWSPVGISFVSQDRGVSTAGDAGTGNLIAVSAGRTTIGSYVDWSDPARPTISPDSPASAAQLAAAGIPTAPQAGH